MLCEKCTSIDLFGDARITGITGNIELHSSFDSVVSLAKKGCEICKALVEKVNLKRSIVHGDPIRFQLLYGRNEGAATNGRRTVSGIRFWEWDSHTKRRGFDVSFEFFIRNGYSEELSQAFGGREVASSPDADACYDLCTQWITDCRKNHLDTCPQAPTNFPTRLLDLGHDGPKSGSIQLRIMDSNELGTWVTLSHCWGSRSWLKTTKETLRERVNCIKTTDLPPTFRDAVTVSRRLGFRYLWVDSLCIVQNDHEDWLREASRMHDYYKKSALTIAVDCASGDDEGFLHKMRVPDDEPMACISVRTPSLPMENGGKCVFMRSPKRAPREPLHRRAWTLQEVLLSPRTIHYTALGLVWECQHLMSSEYNLDPWARISRRFLVPYGRLQDPVIPYHEDSSSPFLKWNSAIEDYVQRSLTIPSDKFPAISGVAKEIHLQTQATYRAGIWLEDIHRGLSWTFCGLGQPSEEYRAPSWSWASLDMVHKHQTGWNYNYGSFTSFIWNLDWLDTRNQLQAQILECQVSPSGFDLYGEVSSGSLTLRSFWTSWNHVREQGKAELWKNDPIINRYERPFMGGEESPARSWNSIICTFDTYFEPDLEDDRFVDLSLAQLVTRPITNIAVSLGWLARRGGTEDESGRQYVMLLKPAGIEGQFRRVGIGEIPYTYREVEFVEDGWEMTTVTII